MKRIFFVLVWMCMHCVMTAQIINPDTTTKSDTSSQTIHNGLLEVFEGNPGKAAIRGLLYPAGGQIYNKKWWKVPIALGIEAGTISYLVYTYNRYSFWNDEYISVAINKNTPKTSLTTSALILKQRNKARGNREMAWVYFAAGHIFTAFEAYIDRHLIEFDVSDDLSFRLIKSQLGPVPSLTYTIPLNHQKYKTLD